MRHRAPAGSALTAEPAPAGNVLGRVVERVASSGAGRSGALAERIARDNPAPARPTSSPSSSAASDGG